MSTPILNRYPYKEPKDKTMYAQTAPAPLAVRRQALQAHETLHYDFEQLIGAALVDPVWRHRLLGDPSGAARAFGLSDADAKMVAHIRAPDLPSFVRSVRPLLYGAPPQARLAG